MTTGLRGLIRATPLSEDPQSTVLCLIVAPGDKRRYCKGGIGLKQTRRRVVRLSVTSEMGERGREAAVSCRKGGVLTRAFFPATMASSSDQAR